jgi:parallel beta-helix repeat protein
MTACPRPAVGAGRDRGRFRLKPELLALEDRRLLSTFTVTSTADDGSTGTLRWAIAQANATSGANTVNFDATAFARPQVITLSGSQLELSNRSGTQTVTGPAVGVTISGGGKSRVLQVDGGVNAAVSGLTISGGSASGPGGGLYIQATGTVTLTGCIISGNGTSWGTKGGGGGLFNYGTATLTSCTVSGNSGMFGGGVDNRYGTMTFVDCAVSGNLGQYGGGGLLNYGKMTMTNCTVGGNRSLRQGPGAGLLNVGTLRLTGCTVTGNWGASSGGGLSNDGKATMALTGCTISDNSAGNGGGLDNSGSAALTLTGCTVSGNTASNGGGGVSTGNGATMILSSCTVSGNTASNGGGLAIASTTTLTDCTVSGNTASGIGGGIEGSGMTITACTVSGNTASNGGGLSTYFGTVLTDTIVAGNTVHPFIASDISGAVTGSYNLVGTGGAGGLTNGSNGNIVLASLTDVGLAPLGDYGGPTQTIALLPGSPALGAGVAVPPISTDQRGEPLDRPHPDIGAFQSQGFTLTPAPGSTPQATTVGTAFANPLAVTVIANNSIEPIGGGIIAFTAPSQGPSASLSATTAAIGASGVAQVNATANSIGGPCTVTASAASSATAASFALTNIAQPVFSGLSGPTINYGTASVTLSGTILAGSTAPPGSVSITVNGDTQSAVIQANGRFSSVFNTANLGVAGSPYMITYAYAATVGFLSATDTSHELTVSPATPAITWPSPAGITYGTALGSTQLDAATNVQGTFTYTPAAGTILPVGAGQTLSVTFVPTDTTDYTDATTSTTINVAQATPMITWPSPTDITYGTALSSTQLDATASSVVGGKTVTVAGTLTYLTAAGTILPAGKGETLSVTFTPTDAVDYKSTSATTTINIDQATPTVAWSNPADITYGTALSSTQLDATASVPGTFAYKPAAVTILRAGVGQTLSVSFEPTDSTDYTTATATATINVDQATPAITWPNPADITYGTPLSGTQLDASATVPGAFAYTPALGTILGAGGNQLFTASFTPTDSTDYTATSTTVHINVAMAQPSFSQLTASQSITYGQSINVSGQLAAPTAIPVGEYISITIGSASATATIQSRGSFSATIDTSALGASSTPYAITYDYPGDANFQSARDSSTTLTVNKATPTLIWPNPADIADGTPLSSTQLDATASVAGSFTYTPAADTVLKAGGGQTLTVSFTPTDSANYKSASTTATINVGKTTPTITWPNPVEITYGTPLSSIQLDATASIPGSFAYLPAAGAILNAGAGQILTVTFTPNDVADYTTAVQTTIIGVAKATPMITLIAPGGTFGGSPFPASVTIAGAGTQAAPAASLEDVAPALTYYLGSSDSGTSLGSTPPIHPGTYTVVASFAGSADYTATQSSPVTFTIDKSAPGIVLIPSIDSSVFGETVTLVAGVSFGAATPGGSVTFYDGSTPLGTVPVDASGKARLITSSLAIGSHSLTASYGGDADLLAGASGASTVSVSRAATQVVLVPQPVFNKKHKLVSLGLRAEVQPTAPGTGVPTGMVTFEIQKKSRKKVTEKVLGTMTLSDGSATLAVKPDSVFKQPVTILYSGDSDFFTSMVTPSLLTRKALQSM